MKQFFLILLCLALAACQPGPRTEQSLQQRVLAAGKIRCGYYDWDPLLKKDVNTGAYSGIAADMMAEIGSRLNLQIDWAEELGPATIAEAVKTKRVDMICTPAIITTPRMRVADFSEPVLYSRFSVWMRSDAVLIDTAELNQPRYKFVAIDGTAPMAMTKRLFPHAGIVSLTELSPTSDMFLSVTGKKADAVFSDASNAGMFDRYNPGQIKPVSDPDTDRVLPWALMLPQNETCFTRMIDLVLQDMQLDGTMAKIVKAHQAEKMYLPAAMRYQAQGF